jgi:AraC-like DNA-binding protein
VNQVTRSAESCRRRSLHVLTRRALNILATELDLGRAALAKQLRCHPTELSRHFHSDMGVTLVRYRTRLRLLSFIREVDVTARNFVDAALLAGFGSYSQCHRAFGAELGCSPSEFFQGAVREAMENRFTPLP